MISAPPTGPAAAGRVSVVMLTHSRCTEAARGLERLLALPERPGIVVVDSGSTDDTARVLRGRFPEVEVVSLGRNIGAAARNVGVERVRTPYVALCDDDTWWAPGALTRAADLLDAHPRLAVVTGRVLVGAEEREDPTCTRMAASPIPASPGVPGRAVLGFLAGAAVIRRAAFLSVGGFEARFFLGGEEALVALDLTAAGWAIAYCGDVVAHHYPSPLRDARSRRRLLIRNGLWLAWLRRPARSALRETLRAARLALGEPAAALGLLQAVAGLPWALRNRRVIPPHVEAALDRLGAADP